MCVDTYLYTHALTHIYKNTHIYTHIYTHTYIYTHIHTDTVHTYIHIDMRT